MRTTRSSARAETFSNFMTDILTILVSEESLDLADVASLQQTCHTSNNILSSESSNDIWKTLATRIWPEVGKLVVSELDNNDIDNDIDEDSGMDMDDGHQPKCTTYRELFINYPSTWLKMEVARVQALPQWSKARHLHSKGGTLECGKCGCNCNGEGCPGIDIETDFRWERKNADDLGYFSSRATVPAGEGYQHSGGTMVKISQFCEPCFERMVELGETPPSNDDWHSNAHVKREDYERVAGCNLFNATTNYVINEEGQNPYPPESNRPDCFYCDPFFTSRGWGWQKLHRVDSDDAAIVIAHALIQPNCVHKHLNIAELHCSKAIGSVGYKALAFAISINTSLRSITTQEGDCNSRDCVSEDQHMTEPGFDPSYHYDSRKTPNKDSSNGLFEKAFLHNQSSNLQKLRLCSVAFGERTLLRLDSFMKDEKKVAAKRKRECDGM